MEEQFEQHHRPNRSQLEQWRKEITRMRELNWPYEKIAKWLLEQQRLRISAQAIHQFCQRRRITGEQSIVAPNPRTPPARPTEKSAKCFDFDANKPIQRYPETTPPPTP